MPKQCEICEKKSVMESGRIKTISKYNPTPKRRKRPNLQQIKVPSDITKSKLKKFAGKKIVSCTKCIKTIGKS